MKEEAVRCRLPAAAGPGAGRHLPRAGRRRGHRGGAGVAGPGRRRRDDVRARGRGAAPARHAQVSLRVDDMDDQFDLGVDLMIRGLETECPHSPRALRAAADTPGADYEQRAGRVPAPPAWPVHPGSRARTGIGCGITFVIWQDWPWRHGAGWADAGRRGWFDSWLSGNSEDGGVDPVVTGQLGPGIRSP